MTEAVYNGDSSDAAVVVQYEKQSSSLLLGYRDELLSLDCWQGCFHCEYTILAEG
jgi:hypothetical protein